MVVQDTVSGFALGLSLIVAIGAQNVFVLQQGIKRQHVLPIVLTCAISDAILIAVGVGGFGWILKNAAWVEPFFLTAGAGFLFLYGGLSAYRAIRFSNEALDLSQSSSGTLTTALLTCLALTWLNPHVYLDTVVLMGTVASQHSDRFAFGLGAVISSFFFFFSLGYGAKRLAPLFKSRKAWRILDAIVAIIMWTIALRLLLV